MSLAASIILDFKSLGTGLLFENSLTSTFVAMQSKVSNSSSSFLATQVDELSLSFVHAHSDSQRPQASYRDSEASISRERIYHKNNRSGASAFS